MKFASSGLLVVFFSVSHNFQLEGRGVSKSLPIVTKQHWPQFTEQLSTLQPRPHDTPPTIATLATPRKEKMALCE